MPSPGELASKEPLSPEGALRQVSVPDTGGMWRGPNPSLCSAQSPSSLGPASKPSLLCVPPGAGFRDNASCSGGVGPGTAPACPPCSCLFSCPIPTPFCPLSWAWVGVWGQLGYVGSLCLAWGCAHREPHSGQGSVEGPWPSSMPVSGLTLGPLHRETLSIPTPASVSLHPLSGPAYRNNPGPFPTQGFSPSSWSLSGNVQFLNTHLGSPGHGSAL